MLRTLAKLPLLARLRRRVAIRFLVSLRRATHRIPITLRSITRSRVLVVAPHMDDETIACGGTLILHRECGSDVGVVFVSDSGGQSSEPGVRAQLGELRAREMDAARGILGFESFEELGFPDGRLLEHEAEIGRRLRELIEERNPDVVFCPFPADSHADHQAVALAVGAAARDADFGGEIWAYEVWSAIWPNVVVDITRVASTKDRAIRCYASQIDDRDYAAATLGLNRYRGLPNRVDIAEAFYVDSSSGFAELAGMLNRW